MRSDDLSILFVDDEASVLQSLKRFLIQEPYQFLFAQSGEEALEIMAGQPVCVIVTDMKMPGMDGLALLNRVKKSSPDTVRLVFSGYTQLSAIIPAINSGEIYRYITKPLEPDRFKQTLNDAVNFYLLNRDRHDLVKRLEKKNRELSRALKEKKAVQQKLGRAQARIETTLLKAAPPENIGPVDIAVFNRSAQDMGGDFHDIIKTAPDGFDILLGDVMGKGILAALVGAGTKQYFLKALGQRNNRATGAPPSPALVTQRVHQQITPGLLDLESFVTSLYARIDLEKGAMVFSDCGHTPILHYQASQRRCKVHKGPNTPLGVMEKEAIQKMQIQFTPGDILVFFSDGVIETQSPDNQFFGIDRLSQFIASHHHLGPAKMMAMLEKSLNIFRESSDLQDDTTCICIKIKDISR